MLSFKSWVFYLSTMMLFWSCSPPTPATLAPLFSDHMVLQQEATVPIWGKGQPGALIKIKATWGATSSAEVDANGEWLVQLETPSFGGPYTIEIETGTQNLILQDVLIGEVWLASGQSNMEWTLGQRINNQEEEIANADFNSIRMFSVPRDLTGTKLKDAKWQVAHPTTIKSFSAVGYFFARELYEKLGVPVGILNTSWGGTRVEAWMRLEELAKHSMTKEAVKELLAVGGYENLKATQLKYNDSIRQLNEAFLEHKAQKAPQPNDSLALQNLSFNDKGFENITLNTDDWTGIQLKNTEDIPSNKMILPFESLFNNNKWGDDGVVWYRKKFDLSIAESGSYELVFEGGIDDWSQTYLNGVLLGQSWSCCSEIRYVIPRALLREGENTLAVRVIDLRGGGGFSGNIFIAHEGKTHSIEEGVWHFKQQAFYINGYFYQHNYSNAELLQNEGYLDKILSYGITLNNPNSFGILNEKMLQPLVPYAIKGALWYQGEGNVNNFQDYEELFSSMIVDWRRQWGSKFPFYFVQIAPYKYSPQQQSQALRDAQRKSLAVPQTGMVVTLDIGEEGDIHPANKQDVGARLARFAFANEYGQQNIIPSGPLYKNHKINKNTIEVYFDYAQEGLLQKGPLNGFEIAGAEGTFYLANAKIVDNHVVVSHPRVKQPKHVRYGWKNYFDATLFNHEGLPASSFNTTSL